MARQSLADETKRAHIEFLMHAAERRRHAMIEPFALGEAAHQFAAGGIDIALVDIMQIVFRPGIEGERQLAVRGREKRPVEKAAVRH